MDRSLADIEDRTAEHVEAYRDSAPFYPPSRRRRSARCPTFRSAGEYGKTRRRVGRAVVLPSTGRRRRPRGRREVEEAIADADRRELRGRLWDAIDALDGDRRRDRAAATAQATVRSIVIARARETVRARETARARVTVRRPPITGPSTRSRNCRASTLPSPPRCSGSSIRTGTWSSATGGGGSSRRSPMTSAVSTSTTTTPEPMTVDAYDRYLDAVRALADRLGVSHWELYMVLQRVAAETTSSG